MLACRGVCLYGFCPRSETDLDVTSHAIFAVHRSVIAGSLLLRFKLVPTPRAGRKASI